MKMMLIPLLTTLRVIAGTPPSCSEGMCKSITPESYDYESLPSARSCVSNQCMSCSYGGAIEATFLVWQAREDGLTLAFETTPLSRSKFLKSSVDATAENMDFSWAPAFKLNYEQAFSNAWDFDTRWTYFYSKSTTRASSSEGYLPIWIAPESISEQPELVVDSIQGIWWLHLNTFDLELGYHPLLTHHLSLRMHCGVKAAFITQQFAVTYDEGMRNGEKIFYSSESSHEMHSAGAGARLGFNSMWRLNKGWYLSLDSAASFILTSFHMKRSDQDSGKVTPPQDIAVVDSFLKAGVYVIRPCFEALIGLGWNHCFGTANQYTFNWKAGYEVQYFWEQNVLRQLSTTSIKYNPFTARGDLNCHGLTTTFRFGF